MDIFEAMGLFLHSLLPRVIKLPVQINLKLASSRSELDSFQEQPLLNIGVGIRRF